MFNQAYPGLETIIHGAETRTADGRSRMYVNCLREGGPGPLPEGGES